MNLMNPFNANDLYNQWVKTLKDSMKMPQSPEQIRREWYKTLRTEELWEIHDEVTRELRSRT